MEPYPYKFKPIYLEKLWGGRALERLFGRALPAGKMIGESWELADLPQGVSVASQGPEAGRPLTELASALGERLLGEARAMPDGRFPLLLKLLDANETLSLQVHPDADAARTLGGGAVPKTECWYVLESRGGFIYKGVQDGVDAEELRRAVQADRVEPLLRRFDVAAGDFHYLPAGTVHALGGGVVVAEVQTPSDTTFRMTDWGRGRSTHLEQALACMRLGPAPDRTPGAAGQTLLATEFFTVALRTVQRGERALPAGRCAALMVLRAEGAAEVCHDGAAEPAVPVGPGETVLVPAALHRPRVRTSGRCTWLEIALPEAS